MEPDQISQLYLVKDQIITFLNWLEDSEKSSEHLQLMEFKKLAWDIHVRSLDWVNNTEAQYLHAACEAIEESMATHL